MVEATRGYRELIVWQKAMDLVPMVYRLTKCFPDDERFGLSSQIRRAAVSIPANIAEGQARQHTAEFAQALAIARGSLAELDTLLLTAVRLSYLRAGDLQSATSLMIEIRRILQRFIQSLRVKRR